MIFREKYRPVEGHEIRDIPDGTEVIVERRHYEYTKGYPLESSYYRAIIGSHMTVSGMMKHMTPEPNMDFPDIPEWQVPLYAENMGEIMQLWIRREK